MECQAKHLQRPQLESAQRRLKTTYKVGTLAGNTNEEGVGESQDLARLLIGSFYQMRTERKADVKVMAEFPVRHFSAEGALSTALQAPQQPAGQVHCRLPLHHCEHKVFGMARAA